MHSSRAELKWAGYGFIAGFVLCYLLVAGLSSPNGTRLTASGTKVLPSLPPTRSKPVTVHVTNTIFLTNSEFDLPLQNASPIMINEGFIKRGSMGSALRPTYSLDLIDTRAVPPSRLR